MVFILELLSASAIQEALGNSINNLLKLFERPEIDVNFVLSLVWIWNKCF